MNKSLLRKLTLYLAFIQLFSNGIKEFSKSDNSEYTFDSNEPAIEEQITPRSSMSKVVLVDDDENNPIYKREDMFTGNVKIISIFDEENISSNQYGASQRVFQTRFYELIRDPEIWQEVQAHFPLSDFDSKDEALKFYKTYFNFIDDNGCGYAVAADYIFRLFEGREQEFYDIFGFPMYSVRKNFVDFNYELMMLKFFHYSIIKKYGSLEIIRLSVENKLCEEELEETEKARKTNRVGFSEFKNWKKAQWDEWSAVNNELRNKIKALQERIKGLGDSAEYGVLLDINFGYLRGFLKQYGIDINVTIEDGLNGSNIDDIVAREGFRLSEIDSYGNTGRTITNIGPHYIYITGVTEDGKYIVSSWGYCYLLGEKAEWTKRIILSNEK